MTLAIQWLEISVLYYYFIEKPALTLPPAPAPTWNDMKTINLEVLWKMKVILQGSILSISSWESSIDIKWFLKYFTLKNRES